MKKIQINLPFWKKLSQRQKRIGSTLLIFAFALLSFIAGSLLPLNQQYATAVDDALHESFNTHKADNSLILYMFTNNFLICLLMFVPIAGPTAGFIILGKTGIALHAIVTAQGMTLTAGWISQFSTPVFWIEFAVYAIAMTESIWLYRRMLKHQWQELKITVALIGVCAVTLVCAALLEAWIINVAT